MRIDKLHVQNFKGFDDREFEFNPRFNLIVGDNGKGKTTLLDALAVVIRRAFYGIPEYDLHKIPQGNVRTLRVNILGEMRKQHQFPLDIAADGTVFSDKRSWSANIFETDNNTDTAESSICITDVSSDSAIKRWKKDSLYPMIGINQLITSNPSQILPLLCYYSAGRLLQESHETYQVLNPDELIGTKGLFRLDGYKNSLDSRIALRDLMLWFARQEWLLFRRQKTSNYHSVTAAVPGCIEGAEKIVFDPEEGELMVTIAGQGMQPFSNLSDGQRTMLAMVADIARRAAMLNPQLGERVLLDTPGVVLIDELDLHLHPRWQRRVIADLKRTFPAIQFFCTTHSPQLIGQARPEEIIRLDHDSPHPGQSYGMDSNWVLRHVMEGQERDAEVAQRIEAIFAAIDQVVDGDGPLGDDPFQEPLAMIAALRGELGPLPELADAEAMISHYSRFDSEE